MKKIFLVFLAIFCCEQSLKAQHQLEYSGFFDSYYYRYFNITAGGGISAYRGDLSANLGLNNFGYNASVGAFYRLWPRVMFGGEFTLFTLKAEDEHIQRNLSFESQNWEITGIGKFFIIDDAVRVARDRSKPPRLSKPYIFTGVGFLSYNTESWYMEPIPDEAADYEDGERNYPGGTLIIPAGLGVSFYISPSVSVLAEASYRFTFTDYLDDVSERGNADANDGYALFSLKLQYTPDPPSFRRRRKRIKTLPPPAGGGGGQEERTAPSGDPLEEQRQPEPEPEIESDPEPESEPEIEQQPEEEYDWGDWN